MAAHSGAGQRAVRGVPVSHGRRCRPAPRALSARVRLPADRARQVGRALGSARRAAPARPRAGLLHRYAAPPRGVQRQTRGAMRLFQLLLGRPIRSSEDEQERVGPLTGVGVLGLDALGSAAYGPEALLSVLLPLGAEGLRYLGLLSAAIIVLLGLLGISYWQTIGAYPSGGGAYTVVRDNIGKRA